MDISIIDKKQFFKVKWFGYNKKKCHLGAIRQYTKIYPDLLYQFFKFRNEAAHSKNKAFKEID